MSTQSATSVAPAPLSVFHILGGRGKVASTCLLPVLPHVPSTTSTGLHRAVRRHLNRESDRTQSTQRSSGPSQLGNAPGAEPESGQIFTLASLWLP
ncbi:hypothetical protein BCR44DRAFT_1014595 [Catenaria anguillulae PL171]|uniref:Uncharacterized protein n=1 Tax=Catenaria anguillulae PL171 TaxID=765915 RepID=A0A1Y2HTL4_9FUNG|nr:hypothetical protein BCR44DRAFT_1014595 [Catenaria anguillulae PL171]